MSQTRSLTAIALIVFAALPAAAQQEKPIEGAAGSPPATVTPNFQVFGGGAVELSYEEYGKGTGGSISGEVYLEAEARGFYAGVWASPTDQKDDNEVDLYLGYRKELASGFKYDFGYTRYYYPNADWDCCGEVTAKFFTPAGDKFGLGLELAYDPENSIGNAYVYGEYYPTDVWTVSAKYGSFEVLDAASETEWEVGATYAINDETGLDFRYYDGSDYDAYVALNLSFDTTIFGG